MSIQPSNSFSRYLRTDPKHLPIRRWAARSIISADLESYFIWNSLEKAVLPLFERYDLDFRQSSDDLDILLPWLERQLEDSHGATLDADDPFVINTARIAHDLSLETVELALLRFAMLKCQSTPLCKALEVHGHELTLANACRVLADILELDPRDVHKALRLDARLRQTGLLPFSSVHRRHCDLDDWMQVPQSLLNHVFEYYPDGLCIESVLFGTPPKPRLTRRDFSHLGEQLDTLLSYLKNASRGNVVGANVLLHGSPGTGKTEFARWLARATRRPAIEIPAIDEQSGSLDVKERLDTWQLCQGIIPANSHRIVLFDEVEEILSDEGFASHGFRQSSQFGKGFLNTLLETNPLPTIWITNTLSGVDSAYLRRFDMTVHFPLPDETVRRRIAKRAFHDLPVKADLINAIAAQDNLTPAHVEKASRVCRMVNTDDTAHVDTVVRQVLDGDLKAMHRKPLTRITKRKQPPTLPLEPSVLNTNVNPETLLDSLAASGFGRLCFFGPPGTGKTAFATSIAEHLNRPIHVHQVADILGPYVGMTEQNIADAFERASQHGAVLVLDEADSFLQDRRQAEKHWQITQVNQFLTSLEHFQGYVVCTTNLIAELDPAALRRFDFKVEFGTMNEWQAGQMVEMVLRRLGHRRSKPGKRELERLSGAELVPGDFAIALRQGLMNPENTSASMIVDTVLDEARIRAPSTRLPIGFV